VQLKYKVEETVSWGERFWFIQSYSNQVVEALKNIRTQHIHVEMKKNSKFIGQMQGIYPYQFKQIQ